MSATILFFFLSGTVSFISVAEEISVTPVQRNEHQEETVVLLHGIGRGRASLWVLDTRLQQAGYKTLNFPYVSQGVPLEKIALELCCFIKKNVETQHYHLIAHSLGNLIIRLGFRDGYPEGLVRVVMLAPPNRPTELARALRDNPIYKWFSSEDGWQFSSEDFYAQLPIPDVAFGIIAGNRGQALMLQEPNDGVITVESTKLPGMKDWVIVPHAHTFIMNSRLVSEQCISFLETSEFKITASSDLNKVEGKDTFNTNKTEGE
ncbi:MAG: hypothetical protein KAH38_09805 [Candidatus Hydrogenedentes bacterium]|nr:hypothetical protein [Candidatus Hydrogenedentota bacterium]